MATPTTSEYLTIAEAAEVLKVDPSTIRRWIAKGHLRAQRFGERTIRIERAEIRAAVAPQPSRGVAYRMSSDAPVAYLSSDDTPLPPKRRKITAQERQQAEEALARSRLHMEEFRRRGIRFGTPTWILVREAREEQEHERADA